MANPTTNYGWPMPTSTDLVTDLPADFALFGQPVDTSLKALNPETTLGDIAYRSSTSNTNTRLGIGTNGQVLAVSGGVPAWTTTADVTPLTTKGDLFTFTTVDARIGVGANNTVLTADSAEATGLKWATPAAASSGLVLISRQTFTNVATTTTTFDGVFSSTYANYVISVENAFSASGTSGDDFYFQLRYAGPTTQATNYVWSNSTYTIGANTQTLTSAAHPAVQIQLSGDMNTTSERFTGMYNLGLRTTSSPLCAIAGRGLSASSGKAADVFAIVTTSRDYTGFILSSSSSNISGTVAVYGLATV